MVGGAWITGGGGCIEKNFRFTSAGEMGVGVGRTYFLILFNVAQSLFYDTPPNNLAYTPYSTTTAWQVGMFGYVLHHNQPSMVSLLHRTFTSPSLCLILVTRSLGTLSCLASHWSLLSLWYFSIAHFILASSSGFRFMPLLYQREDE